MAEILFHAHSGWRYLVLLVAVAAALYALAGWVGGRRYGRAGVLLSAAFVAVLDAQLLLGLLLLFFTDFYGALTGHIVTMVAAAGVAHATAAMNRKRPPEGRSHAILLAGTVGALALIVAGLLAIGRPLV